MMAKKSLYKVFGLVFCLLIYFFSNAETIFSEETKFSILDNKLSQPESEKLQDKNFSEPILDKYDSLALQAKRIDVKAHPDEVIAILSPHARSAENKSNAFYNNLALAHKAKKNYSLAIKFYEMALKLDPNNSRTHHNIGIALYRKREAKLALYHLKKAKELGIKDSKNDEWIKGVSKTLGIPVD